MSILILRSSIPEGSGDLVHGDAFTVTGTGFGTKSTAAPLVWDNQTNASMATLWNLRWPSGNATYAMDYRSAQRGVAMPHAFVSKYACGCNWNSGSVAGGANVMMWKYLTVPTLPKTFYVSFYQRMDPLYILPADNMKLFDWTNSFGGYDLPDNWYVEYAPFTLANATSATPQWHLNPDAAGLVDPDNNGHGHYWDDGENPCVDWVKVEIEMNISTGSDGYIRIYSDGLRVVNYEGLTDNFTATGANNRSIGIGGYGRDVGTDNWRYFSDIYLDDTLTRLVLANNATLSNATIVETQVLSSFSDTSATATCWKGRLSSGTVYPFIVTASGTRIACAPRTIS